MLGAGTQQVGGLRMALRNALASRTRFAGRGDDAIIISALVLAALGLVMVYSASVFVATKAYKVDWIIFSRQFRLLLVGLMAMLAGMFVDIGVYRKWIKVALLFLCLVMALQLFTPIGPVINHTRRWVNLGIFNLQTADVARCIVVIFLAKVLAKDPELARRPTRKFFAVLVMVGLPMMLTNLQPDLSFSLVIGVTIALVLFLGGMSFFNLGLIGSAGIPVIIYLFLQRPYQIKRLMMFVSSRFSGAEMEYQTLQSLIGFGRGGLLGVGLGQGKQKMLFLPEPHTDFIFSTIGEELGLIGATAVIVCFLVMAIRMFQICSRQSDRFNFLMGSGLAGSMMIFVLINTGVAVGLLPVTGLPLPFISSGGTSLVMSMWTAGVLWNLSRYSRWGFNTLPASRQQLNVRKV